MIVSKGLRKLSTVLLALLIAGNAGMADVAALAAQGPPKGAGSSSIMYSPVPSATSLREVRVKGDVELQNAIADIRPGDTIILADGNYKGFSIIGVKATEENPIHIKAQNYGKAVFTTGLILIRNCEYITLDSFKITFPGETITTSDGKVRTVGVFIDQSNYCRVTTCSFKMETNKDGTEWVFIFGRSEYNRVDYCEFGPFTNNKGGHYVFPCSNQYIEGYDISAINNDRTEWVNGNGPYNPNVPRYTRIDHNYFYDNTKSETICLGGAGIAGDYQNMGNVVEYNLLVNCSGDAEMIAIKGSNNIVRYNTVIESNGMISSRAGNNNEIYGNYMLQGGKKGTGGIKIYEKGHKVYNNYVEGTVDLAFLFGSGNGYADKYPDGRLAFTHAQVVGAQVVSNTFVGVNEWQVRSGWTNSASKKSGNKPLTPVDSIFANNLIIGDTYSLLFEEGQLQTVLYANNIIDGQIKDTISHAENDPGKFRVVQDAAMTRVDGVARLWFTNPAIDAGNAQYSSFVKEDINGKPRTGTLDVGAEEFSTENAAGRILKWTDVGPYALVQGLTEPTLLPKEEEPGPAADLIVLDEQSPVFDKNVKNQKDVPVKVLYKGNTLTAISNAGVMTDGNTGKPIEKRYAITENDYFITDVVTDTVTGAVYSNVYNIKKEFLANMRVGEAIPFTFKFSDGKSASFKVKIVDTSIPTMVAPANVKVKTSDVPVKVDIGRAVAASDVMLTNNAPEVFPVGETVVTWTATNRYGYTSTATQIVKVQLKKKHQHGHHKQH